MIDLNIIKLYENSNKLNEAKADIDNFINKFGEDTYEFFKKSTQRLKNNGISTDLTYHVKHTTKKDLDAILTNLQNRAVTKDNDLTKIDGDYEYLGEGKGYKVYKINDVVASINLGAGTGWCISGRYGHYGEKNYTPTRSTAKEHWDSYTEEGAQFYFFISNKDKVALALYPETISYDGIVGNAYVKKTNCEIYDEHDDLNYGLLPNLPVNLIDRTIVFKGHPFENGLYIKDDVLVKCDKSLKDVTIPDNVTSIGEEAFASCESLKSITIPDSVKSIDDLAFWGCRGLISINIPNGVTSIGRSAFSGCHSLTNITIPDSVTSIGAHAFYYCESLKTITIPDTVQSIRLNTFRSCSSLTNVFIGSGVENITAGAFKDCPNLTNIEVSSNNPNYKSIDGKLYTKDGKLVF